MTPPKAWLQARLAAWLERRPGMGPALLLLIREGAGISTLDSQWRSLTLDPPPVGKRGRGFTQLESLPPGPWENASWATSSLPQGETLLLLSGGSQASPSRCADWCRQVSLRLYQRRESSYHHTLAGLCSVPKEQRRFFSHVLHKGLSQHLTAATLYAEVAVTDLQQSAPSHPILADLQDVRGQLEQGGQGLRRFFDVYLQPHDKGSFAQRLLRLGYAQSSLSLDVPAEVADPAEPAATAIIEALFHWVTLGPASPKVRHYSRRGWQGLECSGRIGCDDGALRAWLRVARLLGVRVSRRSDSLRLSWRPGRPQEPVRARRT